MPGRPGKGLMLLSDHSVQNASIAYRTLLHKDGCIQSITVKITVGHNAVA